MADSVPLEITHTVDSAQPQNVYLVDPRLSELTNRMTVDLSNTEPKNNSPPYHISDKKQGEALPSSSLDHNSSAMTVGIHQHHKHCTYDDRGDNDDCDTMMNTMTNDTGDAAACSSFSEEFCSADQPSAVTETINIPHDNVRAEEHHSELSSGDMVTASEDGQMTDMSGQDSVLQDRALNVSIDNHVGKDLSADQNKCDGQTASSDSEETIKVETLADKAEDAAESISSKIQTIEDSNKTEKQKSKKKLKKELKKEKKNKPTKKVSEKADTRANSKESKSASSEAGSAADSSVSATAKEEDSWDVLFDDEGECLDRDLKKEV